MAAVLDQLALRGGDWTGLLDQLTVVNTQHALLMEQVGPEDGMEGPGLGGGCAGVET